MNFWIRTALVASGSLLAALLVGTLGAITILHEPAKSVRAIAEYLLLSGGLAVVTGTAGVLLGMRFLPRLSLKMGLGYLLATLAAIITVLYTPLLMFKEAQDLHLLSLLLVCFLVISLGLAAVIGLSVAQRVRVLRDAARRVAAGDFDAHVELASGDELSELAGAFNRMSAELGQAFARERIAEQGRRDMVAAISHDLRTPLASMRAMLEAIQDGVVQDAGTVADYHVRMSDEVDRLSRLIDDLFELSRIEAGQLPLELMRVDPAELIHETVASAALRAQERGLALRCSLPERLASVYVDPNQLHRVLLNLLQNAIRHTPPGGTITIGAVADDAHLTVEVSDSGEGIAGEDLPHVFERFYRGEKSRSRQGAGAGLGLAISKAIVEAHHGSIWVDSEPHHGARFAFTLPTA